jgi:hypothetical protein
MQQVVGDRGTDEGGRAYSALEVALVEQLLIRREDRQPRHAQLHGQRPGGGKPLAGAEPAIEDGAPDPFVDLTVEWNGVRPVDGEV